MQESRAQSHCYYRQSWARNAISSPSPDAKRRQQINEASRDASDGLVDQGVVQSLSIRLKAAQALQRGHAAELMKIIEDFMIKLRVVGIVVDHRPDLKAR